MAIIILGDSVVNCGRTRGSKLRRGQQAAPPAVVVDEERKINFLGALAGLKR